MVTIHHITLTITGSDPDSDSGQGWRLLFSAGREERGGWRKSISDTGGETAGGPAVVVVVGSYQCNERETMERLLRTGRRIYLGYNSFTVCPVSGTQHIRRSLMTVTVVPLKLVYYHVMVDVDMFGVYCERREGGGDVALQPGGD